MADISVLLVGASGALGDPILQELINQRSSFKRIAILATPDRAHKFKDSEVEVVSGSLVNASSYQGFTHVISAVGNALMLLQPAMIEAAIEAGVKHFYASEWNSDIDQKEIYTWRYFRDKQSVRSYLRAKAAQVPGFQFTLMITGIFTEWSVIDLYGFDHDNHTARIYGKPENRVGVTSIPDCARYTIDSLRIPFEGKGRVLRVQGWTGKFEDLIAQMQKARGIKYSITYVDVEEAAKKQELSRLEGDDWPEMKYSIIPLVASGFGVADGAGNLDNHLFNFIPETPDQTFARVYAGK